MKSFLLNSLILATAAVAQWDDGSAADSGDSGDSWGDVGSIVSDSWSVAGGESWAGSVTDSWSTSTSDSWSTVISDIAGDSYSTAVDASYGSVTSAAADPYSTVDSGYGGVVSSVLGDYSTPSSDSYAAVTTAAPDSWANNNVVVVTSTTQVTKTVQISDCCGKMATAAYSSVGTVPSDGSILLMAVGGSPGVANFAAGNGSAPFGNSSAPFGNGTADADTDDAPPQTCDGPSEAGADCSGSLGCCGNFSCDPVSLTCMSPDSISLQASNATMPSGGNGTTTSGDSSSSDMASLTDNNALNPDDSELGEAGP